MLADWNVLNCMGNLEVGWKKIVKGKNAQSQIFNSNRGEKNYMYISKPIHEPIVKIVIDWMNMCINSIFLKTHQN